VLGADVSGSNEKKKEERGGEFFIIARFHAREGEETALAEAIRDVSGPTRQESGCLSYQAFTSTRDRRLFFINSEWVDEAAFERHAELPHTVRFIGRAEALIDHQLDVNRTTRIINL
jgi:quinol monooxygenase YgiN